MKSEKVVHKNVIRGWKLSKYCQNKKFNPDKFLFKNSDHLPLIFSDKFALFWKLLTIRIKMSFFALFVNSEGSGNRIKLLE